MELFAGVARMDCMDPHVARMAALLKRLREGRAISRRQLADHAGVQPSVVSRAERGMDAKLSTWGKLFEGLGYHTPWESMEMAEEIADLLADEADRRRERRLAGLLAAKRRF